MQHPSAKVGRAAIGHGFAQLQWGAARRRPCRLRWCWEKAGGLHQAQREANVPAQLGAVAMEGGEASAEGRADQWWSVSLRSRSR